MAAVKISGVLKDGAGKPIQNCTIQLKAKRNSTTVLVNTVASENPDEAGRYSMDVEYGQYSVILLVEGFPPSHAGTITVYEGSRPGTLNDFLGAMTEDDVMPEALRRFEAMVEEAARNAEAASQSAAAAKKSKLQRHHRGTRRKPQKRMQLIVHRRQRPHRLHRQTPRQQPKNQKPTRKTARQPQRRAKPTQSPARRQRKPAKRMPKPVKLRQKQPGCSSPKRERGSRFCDFSSWISNCCG